MMVKCCMMPCSCLCVYLMVLCYSQTFELLLFGTLLGAAAAVLLEARERERPRTRPGEERERETPGQGCLSRERETVLRDVA